MFCVLALTFQFPSNGKAHSDKTHRNSQSDLFKSFNSLQTGRHIQTQKQLRARVWQAMVSIPFKREGTFRPEAKVMQGSGSLLEFQFPSNGKAHSDRQTLIRRRQTLIRRFNSLQTGRHIQTYYLVCHDHLPRIRFQFPSNGKAHSDSSLGGEVSIGLL